MKEEEFLVILKPSPIDGIGIFATTFIKKGRIVLPRIKTRRAKIIDIPSAFLKYCVFLNNEECSCPNSFIHMEIGWYMNHSDKPNVMRKEDRNIYAIEDIKEGDEILIDYNQFEEPEHLKDEYFKNLI